MAARLEVSDPILQAYLGHISMTTLGAHYRKIDRNDLQIIPDVFENWRNQPARG